VGLPSVSIAPCVYPTPRPLAGEVWKTLADLHGRMQALARSLGLLCAKR
jgi:hypothetical protein